MRGVRHTFISALLLMGDVRCRNTPFGEVSATQIREHTNCRFRSGGLLIPRDLHLDLTVP